MDKGNILEDAVHAIESAILQSSPALSSNTFAIQSKKRVTVEGVRHEIDIYVEIDIATGYKAIYIFECKNWQETVGKNEVIVFSEKVDALQAQKGFFVAKSFSKDAIAQAKKDPRIEPLIATEHNFAETPRPFDFHTIINEKEKSVSSVEFRGATANAAAAVPIAWEAQATLNGTPIDLRMYVEEWVGRIMDENLRHFPSNALSDGVYERTETSGKTFENGELVINGQEIRSATLNTKFFVRVLRPTILSHFEVATRGRVISFAPITIGNDGSVQTTLILHSGNSKEV
jgi:hypothetical protein